MLTLRHGAPPAVQRLNGGIGSREIEGWASALWAPRQRMVSLATQHRALRNDLHETSTPVSLYRPYRFRRRAGRDSFAAARNGRGHARLVGDHRRLFGR